MLSWVNDYWPLGKLQKLLAAFERDGELVHRWSCGNTKKIRKGDRIFLLQKGSEKGGLFGSGYVLSDKPIEDLHFEEGRASKGVTSQYVDVKFDLLVDPAEPVVLRSELDGKRLSCNTWTIEGSGKTILEPVADALEIIWAAKSISPSQDILSIEQDLSLSETDREALVLARKGQGQFRKDVIRVWGGFERCVVTLAETSAMLTASHIRAWRNCKTSEQRLDGANGLLLCAHIDRLFDRHLVSFEPRDEALICRVGKLPTHEIADLARLGFANGFSIELSQMKVRESDRERVCSYMSEHFKTFNLLQTFLG